MESRERTVSRVTQFKLSPDTCADGPFKGYERLHWINSAALANREMRFGNLLHHFTPGNLWQAFRQIDGNKAVGIDQVTKQEYGKNLEENLSRLANRIRSGGWYPKPSREKLIPKKPQGGYRPLAIGCLEDKIVQLLTAKVLEAIYEPIFHRHSYGFRAGKNTHQALARLYKVISERPENCIVVEMDIEKFFNSMDHALLMELIEKRIEDPHVLRLLRRILRNSILHENGEITLTERGSPQGAPVSPVLANIYLHHVLDEWFDQNWGDKGQIIRYADDAVFVFTSEQVANEFRAALKARLENVGKLRLNSDKSGILRFDRKTPQGPLPFVGFCLYWGRGSKRKPLLKVKTAPKKLGKCIEAFRDWIKSIRQRKKLDTIWELAAAKLRGHYQYYGVSFNLKKLQHYFFTAKEALFKWLNRRSQKRSFTRERFERRLLFRPLPVPSASGLLDITSGLGTQLKHKPRSRMRKSRKSGSNRSAGWQQLAFT